MVSRAKKTPKFERVLQKKRTRGALLDAASRLIERGEKPRLAAIAQEAEVSRATIYRYFTNEESLLVEATLHRHVPDFTKNLEDHQGTPAERAVGIVRSFYEYSVENEGTFRQFMRAVVDWQNGDEDETPRGGRRVEALALALQDANLPPDKLENLRCSLAALTGIEALIVMKDICGVSAKRGGEIVEWAAETLVHAAIEAEGKT